MPIQTSNSVFYSYRFCPLYYQATCFQLFLLQSHYLRLCLKLSQEEMRCVTMTLCYQFSCRIHLFRSRLDILCTSQLFFPRVLFNPKNWPALVHLISPYNSTSDSSIRVKRRKEMILKLLIVKHILLASIIGSVWRIFSRVCILMLKYRG